MTKARGIRNGFTLTEALVAGVILALSALAIGGSINQSLHSLQRARDYQRAAELLDTVMNKIDLIGPDRVGREGPLEGEFDAPDERFTWDATIDPLIDGYLFEVVVTLHWNAGDGPHTATLGTRINDPPKSRNPRLRWEDL